MRRFLSGKYASLVPYVPGEQPRNIQNLIKLNTNESPFAPPESVARAAARAAERLNLYCDTEARALCEAYAELLGISPDELLPTNGSDEILYYAFLAYGDDTRPMAFPDITYGFYKVFADIARVPMRVIPLDSDFGIDYNDYMNIGANAVIANPNAPTGIAIPAQDIESILRANPDYMVIVDEAYADFGGESCVKLIRKYDNLLVTHTFSKSRSLAGARLGFGIGCKPRIDELKAVKNSINPYNVNSLTQAAGIAAIESNDYFMQKIAELNTIRDDCARELRAMGFTVLPSSTNFLFFGNGALAGDVLYSELRARGILVRHFQAPRITPFVRMSIGTRAQMEFVITNIRDILTRREGT